MLLAVLAPLPVGVASLVLIDRTQGLSLLLWLVPAVAILGRRKRWQLSLLAAWSLAVASVLLTGLYMFVALAAAGAGL